MKKNKALAIGGFSLILVIYALLYMATKPKENCDDFCQKMQEVNRELQKNRPFIFSSGPCGPNDSNYCIVVKDTIPYSWDLLADTACIYLKTQSLFQYRVVITKYDLTDTLGVKTCP